MKGSETSATCLIIYHAFMLYISSNIYTLVKIIMAILKMLVNYQLKYEIIYNIDLHILVRKM